MLRCFEAPKQAKEILTTILPMTSILESIEYVNSPPSNFKIASDLVMNDPILSGCETNAIIGYRYDLEGLRSNSTYYFVVYAKRVTC